MIADFVGGESIERRVLREQWVLLSDGGLRFALEAGVEGGKLARVGGFIARRQ